MPKKILIADSDSLFIEHLQEEINKHPDFEVIVSSDGQDALNKARRLNPGLVIAEENLAIIDGYKLCRLLKFDTRRSRMPVVIVTTHMDSEKEVLADDVGADRFLLKHEAVAEVPGLMEKYFK